MKNLDTFSVFLKKSEFSIFKKSENQNVFFQFRPKSQWTFQKRQKRPFWTIVTFVIFSVFFGFFVKIAFFAFFSFF